MEIKPIAHIENDYKDKFAVPRQSGITDIKSRIVFEKEYSSMDAVRGLEDFSHIWLIWGFSENVNSKKSLTVRPPRLGGNKRVGVFASRSPYRPNSLGLSSVKLDSVDYKDSELILTVSGADLISGTPIYDIKPYIKFSDSHPEAVSGFVDTNEFKTLEIDDSLKLLEKVPEEKRNALILALKNDPRPAYHGDGNRIYGFGFSDWEIKFRVENGTAFITEITGV